MILELYDGELVTDIADKPMRSEEALKLVGLGDRMNHFPRAFGL